MQSAVPLQTEPPVRVIPVTKPVRKEKPDVQLSEQEVRLKLISVRKENADLRALLKDNEAILSQNLE